VLLRLPPVPPALPRTRDPAAFIGLFLEPQLPRVALLRATCPPVPRPPLTRPALALSPPLHVAPPPPDPPRTPPACQQLLHACRASPSLKACLGVPLDFFYPFHRAALLLFPSSTRLPSPELRRCLGSPSSATSAAPHPQASAPTALLQPTKAH
jgi:hypothetical protein